MRASLSRLLCLVVVVAVLGAISFTGHPSGSTLARTSALQSDDGPPEPPDIDDPTPEPTEEVDPPAPPDEPDDPDGPTPPDEPEEGEEDDPSGDGTSYTDEENGWSISWDDTWQQTADPKEDGLLVLDNGVSSVIFSVMRGVDDVQDCIGEQVIALVDGEDTSSVSRLMQGGKHVRGGDNSAAFAAYRYNFKNENASIKFVGYFDCRLLPSGQDALLTNLIVVQGSYPDEADGFQALLEGLTIEE